MTPADLQELKRLRELISSNRKEWAYATWTEYEALEKKWAPIDTMGMLLDEVERLDDVASSALKELYPLRGAVKDLAEENAQLQKQHEKLRKVAEAAREASAEIQAQKTMWPVEVDMLADALAELEGEK